MNPKDKTSYKDLIIMQLKKISELASQELRDQTTVHYSSTQVSHETKEDLRESYIEAIRTFGFLLMPHFDEDAKNEFESAGEFLDKYDFEILEEFKEDYKKMLEGAKVNDGLEDFFIIRKKIIRVRKLFSELINLIKRNNFLQGLTDGDTRDETASEEESNKLIDAEKKDD